MAGAICYVHEPLTGREFLTYSNYIFTDFDNRRIATIGKISLNQIIVNSIGYALSGICID
jgi:hypothetical protein